MFARLWGRAAPRDEDLPEIDITIDPAFEHEAPDARGNAAATMAAVDFPEDFQEEDTESLVPPAVIESIARRVIAEVEAEVGRRGQPYSEEQKQQLTLARGQALCLDWMREQQARSQHREVIAELQALRHATLNMDRRQAAQAQSSPGAQLVDLWRRHPFLVGWFGAGAVHALKRERRP